MLRQGIERFTPSGPFFGLQVTDEGRGIPADKLPHIFDKFNRGDEEGVRSIAGTGLGLALCRSLVEAHGGAVATAIFQFLVLASFSNDARGNVSSELAVFLVLAPPRRSILC